MKFEGLEYHSFQNLCCNVYLPSNFQGLKVSVSGNSRTQGYLLSSTPRPKTAPTFAKISAL